MSDAAKPILFDDFVPGALMGERDEVYDATQAARWQALFGTQGSQDSDGAEAASMAVINMMRGYLNLVMPRPPGNMHARQRLQMCSLPEPGETIRVAVRCIAKEVRRERKYVELQVTGNGVQGRALFDAQLTLIWAA